MSLRYGRLFILLFLIMSIVVVLLIRAHADAIRDSWDTFFADLAGLLDNYAVQIFFALALIIGSGIVSLWLLSRMIRWFKSD